MAMALCTLSHSPLMGVNQPEPDVLGELDAAMEQARAAVRAFNPDLVVVFGPDHYNGVFYDMMPPFCVANGANSVGDWLTQAGPLQVDRTAAMHVAKSVLDAGVDVAVSERLQVDHGMTQPLQVLFGDIAAVPVIPIFINSVALPLAPVRRVRLLGEAVGRAVAELDRRVLFLGSGGLSHDPPVPKLEGASPEIAERLSGGGRNPSPETTALRRKNVVRAAQDLVNGVSTMTPLAPDWDRLVMSMLAEGRLTEFDDWTPEEFAADAGNSAHEVRNWIAAYAALSVAGPHEVTSSYYRTVPEWLCGFGTTTARTAG